MDTEVIAAIAHLVAYNWTDEEADYSYDALEPGNSREGHIFRDIMKIQQWLETEHGYPHMEPQILHPEQVDGGDDE